MEIFKVLLLIKFFQKKTFTSEFSDKRIRVEFDETVFGIADELGRIVVTESTAGVSSLPVLARKIGMTPVVRVGGKPSSEDGMLNCPYGIAVDYQTGNIYVSDSKNNRVQVFDSNGEYLRKFGDKMYNPHLITISENRVFVIPFNSNHVSIYDLNGTLIRESQFSYPYGIAISGTNGDIYLCYRNRIQILSKEFQFKSEFGQGILEAPLDIKLTNEFIYVLSNKKPFLYSFTYDFTQIDKIAVNFISKHLRCPHAFCIDGSAHFIISDYTQNAIFIFNRQGELIQKLTNGIHEPGIVTLDSKGRILVCSYHSLLIF